LTPYGADGGQRCNQTLDLAKVITAWSVDCEDPDGLAEFSSAVPGWVVTDRDDDAVAIKPAAYAGWGVDFLGVGRPPRER
jgi:hypothetical protein